MGKKQGVKLRVTFYSTWQKTLLKMCLLLFFPIVNESSLQNRERINFLSNFKVNQAKNITYKYPLVYVSYNELFKMHFYIKIKMLSLINHTNLWVCNT